LNSLCAAFDLDQSHLSSATCARLRAVFNVNNNGPVSFTNSHSSKSLPFFTLSLTIQHTNAAGIPVAPMAAHWKCCRDRQEAITQGS